MKIFLEKLTQVVSQSGKKHGLSGTHICREIHEKQGFYFFVGNCSSAASLLANKLCTGAMSENA